MFSPALEKQRQQLYAQTSRHLTRSLRAVSEPAAMLAVVREGMQRLEYTYDETPAAIRAEVACRSGCHSCCTVCVDVQAHEVFLAAEHIQLHFSPAALAEVIARTGNLRAQHVDLGAQARRHPWLPCPLLEAGQCSIYESRPEACRVHHTSNAVTCAAYAADSAIDLETVYIPTLRARMFAVMLGMDAAIEAAGFDDRSYDFSSALHEALTNSLCRVLWLRRQPAFPDACLAPA
jgi:Fe-S-cluster containining protein